MTATDVGFHSNVRLLHQLVADLDDDVRAYQASGALDPDLIALAMIREARTNLAVLEHDLENRLAQAMDAKTVVVEHAGTFERSKKKARTSWEKDALLSAVLDSRLFDPHTGELVDESPLDRVLAVWNLPAPRVTALRDRNIDADQFCHTEDAGWQIKHIS